MAFEETKEQQQIYIFLRMCIYVFLIIELIMNIPITPESKFTSFCVGLLHRFQIFEHVGSCKLAELILICVTAIGTTAKKSTKFTWMKNVILPTSLGFFFVLLCFILHIGFWGGSTFGFPTNRFWYAITSIIGTVLVDFGLEAIAKHYNHKIGEDRFNFENESFEQSTQITETPYSVNIPMIFYWKKKMHNGWINIINPFRGTIVLGTPGSGKSFGIIDPFIRQHSRKGFAMMVYDYKFPTLAKTLYYQYRKNFHYGHLPKNCSFRIINFTDVEYSSRVNPIQRRYIPDLAAASETAATLLASLNKGGGEKKGGSEAFFTNSAENFLAAIIYYFVNLRPCGYLKGKKLKRFVLYNKRKLELRYFGEDELRAYDENNKLILDFKRADNSNASIDSYGLQVELNQYCYTDKSGNTIYIEKCWYEDDNGNEVVPDTITGEFSDMPHVLALLGKGYKEVFDLLMRNDNIASLMAPFKSAHDNNATDQLEGMVGTLRVNASRLVSPEAYWVFTGDDFDLKISDPNNPSYLVIANDPEKEQIIGTLNALILNRLVTRINSKGNLPVSLIVDELPTLYFHKIDRLIGTARSNKVAVTLGFQELPQLEADYGKVGMQKIITTCGNIFMGAARNKETLEWAQNDIFGKAKQISKSMSINDNKVSTTLSEKVDYLVPAAKIADMATGWLAGQAARDFTPTEKKMMSKFDIENSDEFKTTKYFCKTNFDMGAIKNEESKYVELPRIYSFKDQRTKEIILNRNFKRVNDEVTDLINEVFSNGVPDNKQKK